MHFGKKIGIPKPTVLKEKILIEKAKRGEKQAFGKLYLIYIDEIYRYVFFKTGKKKQIAEDIVQETFLKAWKKIEDFETQKGTFKAWVYQIARNQTIDFYRKKKNEVKIDKKFEDNSQDIEKALIDKEVVEKTLKALEKLTKEQKEVITLICINELSYKEVSKILNKNEDAVRALKYRALKKLKKLTNHEK